MSFSEELRTGTIETAAALGVSPLDLATIFSYETGGTMDPLQIGPTTRWGQHRGLIQFGEPQAMRYGVDWSNPLASQLGADGAVARYFRENGLTDGMGLLDMYSIVNAGAPGRYNASDAANGGAPGTVLEKVQEQMDGHRARAAELLGMDPNSEAGASFTSAVLNEAATADAATREREAQDAASNGTNNDARSSVRRTGFVPRMMDVDDSWLSSPMSAALFRA